ncbi:NACHT domain-containing protein [Novosphingobium sp. B-7]|uniref:NACHT domain-containing protein n=1 Tax=Novosphingobium sp. B-7 TaxID=1298855 RepID=UPI001ED9A789|nr:NACHT domain-containing protein [Novosphingobium sp. B-7]
MSFTISAPEPVRKAAGRNMHFTDIESRAWIDVISDIDAVPGRPDKRQYQMERTFARQSVRTTLAPVSPTAAAIVSSWWIATADRATLPYAQVPSYRGVIFKNHPDVEACAVRFKKNTPEWKEMEALVASHYTALGYSVTPDINLHGSQIDLLCRKYVNGIGTITVAVEVKHRSHGVVGVQEVRSFKEVAIELRRRGIIQNAVLVSNGSFTQDAQAFAHDDYCMRLIRLQDLEQDLFNISESLMKLKLEYEAEPIFEYYIPLAARFKDRTHEDAAALIAEMLKTPKLVVLVGGFGSGKTTVVDKLFYQMVRSRLESQTTRYPVRLRLRTLLQHPDLWSFISSSLREHQYIAPTRAQFERHLAGGEFAFLLDGFDEIKTSAYAEDRARFLQLLSPLIASNCPCLLATRPTYFESFDEMVHAVKKTASRPVYFPRINRERVAADAILAKLNLSHAPSVDSTQLDNVIELEPLSKEQSLEYLKRYEQKFREIRNVSVEHVFEFLRRIYDLKELMQRPLLLEMIAITALEGEIDLHALDTAHVGPSMLYDGYTRICAVRDSGRPSGLTEDERLDASRALAMAMFDKGEVELTADEIAEAIKSLPFAQTRIHAGKRDPAASIADIITDIRVCSFLRFSDDNRSFRFQHKSFFEFFVAQTILMRRLQDYGAFHKLEPSRLTREILYFLGSFARDQTELGLVVCAGVNTQRSSPGVSLLCRQIAFCAGTLLNKLSLIGGEIAGVEVQNLVLSEFDAEAVTFRDFALKGVSGRTWNWDSCNLLRASWTAVTLDNCSIRVSLHKSELDEISISDSDVSLSGHEWTLRHSSLSRGKVALEGSGSLVDVFIDGCKDVALAELSLRPGARVEIANSSVRCETYRGWCASKSRITLRQCQLAGLWIPSLALSELSDSATRPNAILELKDCRGVVFSELDLDDIDKERAQIFRELHPEIEVIAELAVQRALRRRRGERVDMFEFVDVKDADLRDAAIDRVIKNDEAKLWPARRALEKAGMTEILAKLYSELCDVEPPAE